MAASVLDIIRQVRHANPLPPRELNALVPQELSQICLKCLEKDPRHRLATAHELAADLDSFLQHRHVSATPEPK